MENQTKDLKYKLWLARDNFNRAACDLGNKIIGRDYNHKEGTYEFKRKYGLGDILTYRIHGFNGVRELANDGIRKAGNKIKPYVFTGKIFHNKYGLGDILAYRLHSGHAGATTGIAAAGLLWYWSVGFNPIGMIVVSPFAIPTMFVGGLAGYASGVCFSRLSKIEKENKARRQQKNLETI